MASYLGVQCGKTFSFLNAEETETRLGRRTKARPGGGGGGGFHHPYHHNLNPNPTNKSTQQQTNKKQMMMINARACLSSNLDYNNNCRAAVSSSASPINVDPIFGTELEMCCNNRTGEKQQRANAKKRENNKVGSVGGEQKISAEKLDEWMTYSVSEIVRYIGEAPLLVHVYSSKNNNNKGGSGSGSSVGSPPTTIPIPIIERRKAEPESWVGITRRWEEGSPIPDGIILVEQLKEEEPAAADINASSSTKTWGVVIQGRGADSASCYILKTCRVRSSLGGGFCTHFCLVRAKCFGEIADLQLKNSWLVA